jgi:hypothetical protein
MARFKPYDDGQMKMLSVSFKEQILPGTIEYTLNCLIDHEIALEGAASVAGRKVNTRWLHYCLVHNIGKVQRYANLERRRRWTLQ